MIFSILSELKIPVAYGHFKTEQTPPFLVYLGAGQNTFGADNTWYHKGNQYQIEYYFTAKDEEFEEEIESLLLENGYNYGKSEDVYIEDEQIYVIYYTV